jgi:serpin B
VLAGVAAVASALSACGATEVTVAGAGREPGTAVPSPTPTATAGPDPTSPPARGATATTATVAGLEAFAANFYRQAAQPGQNFVFSPLSVGYAFAMLRAGAGGNTAAQLDHAFGFPPGVDAAFQALTAGLVTTTAPPVASGGPSAPRPTLEADPPPSRPVLTIANAMFAQQGYPLQPGFVRTLKDRYGSRVLDTDFGKPTAALAAINNWADQHTAGRIPKILDHLDPATRLAILNAVYLKASWVRAFEQSGNADFAVAGAAVPVPMIREDSQFGYATGANWRSVTLPYFGGTLAMRIILPTGTATPADLINQQTLAAVGRTTPTDVNVTMPKWDFGTDLDLLSLLARLGVIDAFDPATADLSGITAAEKLFVGQAVQKADITVDELGTVASAVTALAAVGASAVVGSTRPVEFTVDRPFAFEIVDTKTSAPLFVGSVADPRAK